MDALGQLIDFSKLESSESFPYGILGYGYGSITKDLTFSKPIRMVVVIPVASTNQPYDILVVTPSSPAAVGAYSSNGSDKLIQGEISDNRLIVTWTNYYGGVYPAAWFIIGG